MMFGDDLTDVFLHGHTKTCVASSACLRTWAIFEFGNGIDNLFLFFWFVFDFGSFVFRSSRGEVDIVARCFGSFAKRGSYGIR